MEKLSLDTFLTGPRDAEMTQYRVLQGLKDYYEEFAHNRLYPSLSDLIQLSDSLWSLLDKKGTIERSLPQRLKEMDIENKKLVFESAGSDDPDLQRVTDLIVWALPLVAKAIDEGTSIFNFVEDHIAIAEVGILPMYKEEGYWFVPEVNAALLHLLRYEVSLYSSAKERFRSLKTVHLESIEQRFLRRSPESIKLELIEKYQDLRNPATFQCEVDIEFPYAETVLPVAKRKLMTQLFS